MVLAGIDSTLQQSPIWSDLRTLKMIVQAEAQRPDTNLFGENIPLGGSGGPFFSAGTKWDNFLQNYIYILVQTQTGKHKVSLQTSLLLANGSRMVIRLKCTHEGHQRSFSVV